VNDIGLASVSGFKKFGDKQAVAASLRFFSMGSVDFTDDQGAFIMSVKPKWMGSWPYLFEEIFHSFSGAVAGRFIYSNLVPVDVSKAANIRPGTSIAADVALYYHKEVEIKGLTGAWFDAGLDISNIGQKMSYSSTANTADFIPTNLRIGPSFTMDIDEYNRVSLGVDFNKLLVPTPPIYAPQDSLHPDKNNPERNGSNVSVVKGIIQSFYDAPYGF